MPKPKINSDGRTITVRVPISIRKRGGRKVVLAPDDSPGSARLLCRGPDNAMIKAVARAFRWREMLEMGAYGTVTELANAEGIDHSYVGRILRLTLLAPDVVESILNDRLSEAVTIANLSHAFPLCWKAQCRKFLETRS
jgi:hypothetical protein